MYLEKKPNRTAKGIRVTVRKGEGGAGGELLLVYVPYVEALYNLFTLDSKSPGRAR